nr:DnaA N-terminal domain-containing protein [Rhabdochlamydiaceae bacterium]
MLTKNQADTWNDFLTYIEEKCSATEFQNWISPIRVDETSTEELVLVVPNIFVQEYLLQNYKKDLANFVPVKTNGHLALKFVIAEEPKKPILQAEPPQQDHLKLNPHYTFEHFIEGVVGVEFEMILVN